MIKLKFLIIATICLVIMAFSNIEDKNDLNGVMREKHPISMDYPPCVQMYFYIEQYADSFDIPKRYAYGVANAETGYKGPFHWKYNPSQTSPTGAEGPMQILLSTARYLNKDDISREQLRNNIEYNIRTSLGYLRRLYNRYKDWKIVFGYYNTGYPQVNGYANKVYNHKLIW